MNVKLFTDVHCNYIIFTAMRIRRQDIFRRKTAMKKFSRAFAVTLAVLVTVISVTAAADYICSKYRKKYISI